MSTASAVEDPRFRAHASVLDTLDERDAADAVIARIQELSARDPSVSEVKLPYALKGVRRALLRRDAPGRAR